MLEDYAALQELVTHLREGDPLLKNIGEKFVSVGVSELSLPFFYFILFLFYFCFIFVFVSTCLLRLMPE